jgi:hypothetical protein
MTLNSDSIPNKNCKREITVFTNLFKLALIAFVGIAAAQSTTPRTTDSGEDWEVCLRQLIGDPKIKPLIGKLAFDLNNPPPLEMLANPSKANPKEKAALNFYSTEWQRCQELGADWRKRELEPDVDALFSVLRVDLSAGLADLYAGQISYGSAAKLRARQWIEFKNGVKAINRLLSAQAAENDKQRQIQTQRDAAAEQESAAQILSQIRRDAAAAQERTAQERSRQQVEANQRRSLELQQQQMTEQREAEVQRAAALKKADSDREWNDHMRRQQEPPAQSTYQAPIFCTTRTTGFGTSNTSCF